jgi:hypothetical protein
MLGQVQTEIRCSGCGRLLRVTNRLRELVERSLDNREYTLACSCGGLTPATLKEAVSWRKFLTIRQTRTTSP